MDSYVIDLTAFDSAFHALFASEEAGVADMPMKPYLPIRFGCVRAFAPGRSRGRRRRAHASPVADVAAHRHRTVRRRRQAHSHRRERAACRCAGRYGTECPVAHLSHDDLAPRPSRRTLGRRRHFKRRAQRRVTKRVRSARPLLLLEAGCLCATWKAFAAKGTDQVASRTASDGEPAPSDWATFLRSALLWHLEYRGLAVDSDGERTLASTCELPDVASIVSSLALRHPTMAAEAASLARIEELLERIVAGDPETPADLNTAHGASSPRAPANRSCCATPFSSMSKARSPAAAATGWCACS